MTQVEGGNESGSVSLAQFWAEDQKLIKVLIGLFNMAESGASEAILGNAAILLGDLVQVRVVLAMGVVKMTKTIIIIVYIQT